MKHFLRLTDFSRSEILDIFRIADEVREGGYSDFLKGKSIVLFFPDTSIRTRLTFEKGVFQLSGQTILFPPQTLDKKEDLRDVCGYLNQWADLLVIRQGNLKKLEYMSQYAKIPIINAMTDCNHPCEILSDLYALSKCRDDFLNDHYLFSGLRGNIGLAWKEASDALGLYLEQCCPKGYEIEELVWHEKAESAIVGKDIICTDSIPAEMIHSFRDCQITKELMDQANSCAVLNPCPPFYRGEEVSQEVMESDYFVGYEFKSHLLEIQQAIIIYCLLR